MLERLKEIAKVAALLGIAALAITRAVVVYEERGRAGGKSASVIPPPPKRGKLRSRLQTCCEFLYTY